MVAGNYKNKEKHSTMECSVLLLGNKSTEFECVELFRTCAARSDRIINVNIIVQVVANSAEWIGLIDP